MGMLDGKVAIVTGAGRGVGRGEAVALAAHGAKVVVNDLGASVVGEGADLSPAQEVVEVIRSRGGEAVVNGDDVSDFEGARRIVQSAIDAFGRLDVLVNNAGILRDRMIFSMSEEEFDSVIRVHLKGTFNTMRHASEYWRTESKEGRQPRASIINTVSSAGLQGQASQANYGAAKAGIAALTVIEAIELARYGVRANAIAPVARTRLTLETPGMEDMVAAPTDAAEFDKFHPGNVSPLVAYLATADCPFTGGVFHVGGGEVGLFTNWTLPERIVKDDRWTVEELREAAPRLQAGRPAIASEGLTIAETLAGFNG